MLEEQLFPASTYFDNKRKKSANGTVQLEETVKPRWKIAAVVVSMLSAIIITLAFFLEDISTRHTVFGLVGSLTGVLFLSYSLLREK